MSAVGEEKSQGGADGFCVVQHPQTKRGVLHHTSCSLCQPGPELFRVTSLKDREIRHTLGRWYGPFGSAEAAREQFIEFGTEYMRECDACFEDAALAQKLIR